MSFGKVWRLDWLVVFCLIGGFTFWQPAWGKSNSKQSSKPSRELDQSKFKKQKIELIQKTRKKTIDVELAETPQQQAQGLMMREKLQENEGMLFVFDDEQPREFWMKNTLINLDIGYFDKNKRLIGIQQMKAANSIMQTDFTTYPSKNQAMYALEMTQGWFKKNKFAEGAEFRFLVLEKNKRSSR